MITRRGQKLYFWILILVIIPMGFVIYIVYSHGKLIVREQIQSILNVAAGGVEARLLSVIDDKEDLVKALSSDPFIMEGLNKAGMGPSKARAELLSADLLKNKKPLDRYILDIFIFDREGSLIAATDGRFLERSSLEEEHPYDWKRGIEEGLIEQSSPLGGFAISSPVIVPYRGDFLGIVTVLFRASALDEALRFEHIRREGAAESGDGSLVEKGRIIVVDRRRTVIASNEPSLLRRHMGIGIVEKAFSEGRKVTEEFVGLDGEWRIGVAMYIREAQWVVVKSFRKTEVFAPLDRLAFKTVPFIYIGVISVIAIAFMLTQRFTRAISVASSVARRIAEGNLDERIKVEGPEVFAALKKIIAGITKLAEAEKAGRKDGGGKDEIWQLIDTFNRMADSLEKSNREREDFLLRLKESEERYRTLFDYAEDSMLMIDDSGKVSAVNKRLEEVLGYPGEEILGSDFSSILDRKGGKAFSALFDKALSGEKPGTIEVEVVSRHQGTLTMEMDLTRVRRKDGRSYVQAHLRNITGSKLLQKEVLLERNKLEAIVESMGDGLDIVDGDFRIQFMNKRFIETFGKDSIGKRCYEVYASREAPCENCPVAAGLEKASVPEVTTPQGQTLLILHSPIRNIDGTISYVEIFKDVTERKRLESTLRELELYNTLFNYAEDSMLMTDHGGRIIAVNKREERVIGYSEEEVIGKEAKAIMAGNSSDAFPALFEKTLRGEKSDTVEVEVSGKSGTLAMEMDLTCIRKGANVEFVVVHLRDITRRKELEQQLLRAERIAALSNFSSTLAHDLRNPIIGIRQRLKSLQGGLNMGEAEERVMTDIIYGCELLLGMVNDVLDVYRNSFEELPLIVSEFPVAEAVDDAVKLLQIEAEEKKIDVTVRGDRTLKVRADKRRLQRVFINLLDNAIKYSDAGSPVKISFEALRENGAGYVALKVEDEGVGIDPDNLSTIFEPLYKVGRKGGKTGTGLGLYFCKVVVDAHGGSIRAANRRGRGSVFSIRLPA